MSLLLLGMRNVTSQSVAALGSIDLGSVYRRYCKKNSCGIPTFSNTTTTVTLQQQGIYHVTATLVGTATAAGIATPLSNNCTVTTPAAVAVPTKVAVT